MKKQLSNLSRFKINRGIKGFLVVVVTGSLLCLDSCKKDGRFDGVSPQAVTVSKTSALQSTAYKVLKAHATSAEFSDLDWNNTAVSNLNGKPYLLRIKSKSDNTKQLFYNKKNGITHVRWVQLKSGTSLSSGSLIVSSLNETNKRESAFEKGRRLSTKVIRTNSQNSSQPTSSSNSSNALAATVPVSSSGSTTATGGIKIRALQLDDEEDGGGDDGGGDDGGGDDGGGFDGGDDGDDGGGTIDPATGDPASPDPGFTWTGVNQLAEVNITAPGTDNTLSLYSLYFLMGDNPAYLFDYTTDPNATSSSNSGTVVVVRTLNPLYDATVPPCTVAIINSLALQGFVSTNIANIFNVSTSVADSHGVAAMLNTIMNNPNYNVAFSATTGPDNVTALTNYGVNPITTTLNINYLNTATKLSVARTIIHESIHSYFTYGMQNLTTDPNFQYFQTINSLLYDSNGNAVGDQNAAQHNQMVADYANGIAQMLVQYANSQGITSPDPSRSLLNYCTDLAWGGLQGTAAYNALSQADQARIAATLNQEKNNTTGATTQKACP
ncbi:MAG: hypothetical protein JWR38_5726 [Mucilaginibacter sp.]|nr:hypothetical protein [Mucilaginibacter sp.]